MSRVPQEVLEDLKKIGKELGLLVHDADLEHIIEAMSDEQVAVLMRSYLEFRDAIACIDSESQKAKQYIAEIEAKAFEILGNPSWC